MPDIYLSRKAECRGNMQRGGMYEIPRTIVPNITKQMADAGYCIDAPDLMPAGSMLADSNADIYCSFLRRS